MIKPVDNKTMIDILLKEYDTLRSEILTRSTQRISFLGLFGATIGYFLFKYNDLMFIQEIGLIFGLVFLGLIWVQLGNIINRCSARITAIEKEINEISGRNLLKWETNNRLTIFNKFHGAITRHNKNNRQQRHPDLLS
ncbi:MAG: hypothetical protein ACMUHX_07670 [bacterium]